MLCDWVESRGTPITIRLVKGAYWDYEVLSARRLGWPEPVYLEKWQSDASFERCTRFLLRHHDRLRPAFGSHNVRSLAHAIAAAEAMGLPPSAYELQTLYGMGDAIQGALVDRGHRVRVYTPYGALLPGMAYLVRRLLENTSNESFLKLSSAAQARIDDLLRDPEEIGAMLTRTRRTKAERPRGGRRAAAVPQRAADRLRPGRDPRGDAAGARGGPRPARPALPADRSAAAEVDTGPRRLGLAQPEPQLADRRRDVDGRRRARRPGRRRRPGRLSRPGAATAGPRPRRGPGPHGRDHAGRAGSSWPRGRSTSAASPGPRPTATSPRRSTSASSTPAR